MPNKILTVEELIELLKKHSNQKAKVYGYDETYDQYHGFAGIENLFDTEEEAKELANYFNVDPEGICLKDY